MEEKMFCFQCEQTSQGTGCKFERGVCGKWADTSDLQDEIIEKLVKLAQTSQYNEKISNLIIKALFATITNVNFDNQSLRKIIEEIEQNITKEPNSDFRLKNIWHGDEDIRSLKSLILFGIKGMAAYAYHAVKLGYKDENVDKFFFTALKALAEVDNTEELFNLVLKTGEINLKCMELLDTANTETYGHPTPTSVSTKIEPGPFIVVSGHDLHDLELLLTQTKDKGINIYTHGEMLPCHAYPKLKSYKHLKGNFGTAWQNQQKEFANLPAPILFTTNCIMPVKESYKDRVFTTEVVEYPEMAHIGEDKDFTPVIEKAIELGGYTETQNFTGINGGDLLTVGFGHNTFIENAPKIIEAVKAGKIKHFFLVGGCDGAKPGRNYYTEFVKLTPPDSIVLTLACGKYRFNDLDLGDIEGIPRILDMGQCNDAYSAIIAAKALSEAFDLPINDLPLSFVLSWYEQKAVCILLTLLYLDIKNMYLGPSLPAFLSPNILNILVKNGNVKPISKPENDLKEMLS